MSNKPSEEMSKKKERVMVAVSPVTHERLTRLAGLMDIPITALVGKMAFAEERRLRSNLTGSEWWRYVQQNMTEQHCVQLRQKLSGKAYTASNAKRLRFEALEDTPLF